MASLWEHEDAIADLEIEGVEIPPWIESDISPADVAAIVQGGCASGAYMPAVTYSTALETMKDYGDEILDYIENALGEPPARPVETSWAGMACHFVSLAVELWAGSVEDAIQEALDAREDVEV